MAIRGRSARSLPLMVVMVCCLLVSQVHGHGRMLSPASRASAWRLGLSVPVNYNDNAQYCGGFPVQYNEVNKGACGICGDRADVFPRPYERPDGSMIKKTDFILNTYFNGTVIKATIDITAQHKGYFEFHLCNVDEVPGQVEATHACLKKHRLQIIGSTPDPYRYQPIDQSKRYNLKLQLPPNLTCKHCVLQWRYHAGNSWGTNPDGTSCVGCGDQEEFYSCADMRIQSERSVITPPGESTTTTPTTTTTKSPPRSTAEPYIPEEILNAVDHYPLTEYDREFFRCNYCLREVENNPANIPKVCKDNYDIDYDYEAGLAYMGMCSRLG